VDLEEGVNPWAWRWSPSVHLQSVEEVLVVLTEGWVAAAAVVVNWFHE